jgi:signal transduction histidine kinase
VLVAATDRAVSVDVSDDGHGGASIRPGSGLAGLADRVEVLHGELAINSSAKGGTSVSAHIPLSSPVS